MNKDDVKFMRKAIKLAEKGMNSNSGGPFGALVVHNGKVIAQAFNCVTSTNDPTAHAEVMAIRAACTKLSSFQLTGCTLYTSCEPCPMCLGAIYWARPDRVVYACDREDASKIEFDDQFIYDELNLDINERKIKFQQVLRNEAFSVFNDWKNKEDKTQY